jgi:hypothetical protein
MYLPYINQRVEKSSHQLVVVAKTGHNTKSTTKNVQDLRFSPQWSRRDYLLDYYPMQCF